MHCQGISGLDISALGVQDSWELLRGILATKFQVTPISEYQAQVISAWAIATGRPVSALCAGLLDQAFNAAMDQGRIPASVIEMVDEAFEPEREIARLTVELAQAKNRNESFLSYAGKAHTLKEQIQEEKDARAGNPGAAKKQRAAASKKEAK